MTQGEVFTLLVSIAAVAADVIHDECERETVRLLAGKLSNGTGLSEDDVAAIRLRLQVTGDFCVKFNGHDDFIRSCISDQAWGIINMINEMSNYTDRVTTGFVLAGYDKIGQLLEERNLPESQRYIALGDIVGKIKDVSR